MLPAIIVLWCQAIYAPAHALAGNVSTWDQLQSEGHLAFDACEYGSAESLLNQAVIKARAFGPADMRLAKSDGELGRLLTVRGRFSEAEPYLEEELRIKEQVTTNENGQLIPDMCTLVRFYLAHGTAAKALPLSEEVLAFVTGKLDDARSPGQAHIKLQQGVPLQGWAGTAAPVMHDPLIEWAISCDELGSLYLARSNFELAERLFRAALDVKSTVLGKQHLSLANSYDNLGSLALAKNENEEAESYFRDALAITEKIQAPQHPQVFSRLDKLARCLIKEGKDKDAEALYLRAKDFWTPDSPLNGTQPRALFALGSLYIDEKNYSAAAPILDQALHLSEQFNGTNSIVLVPYLQKYAYTLYNLGHIPESERFSARAKAIASGSAE